MSEKHVRQYRAQEPQKAPAPRRKPRMPASSGGRLLDAFERWLTGEERQGHIAGYWKAPWAFPLEHGIAYTPDFIAYADPALTLPAALARSLARTRLTEGSLTCYSIVTGTPLEQHGNYDPHQQAARLYPRCRFCTAVRTPQGWQVRIIPALDVLP